MVLLRGNQMGSVLQDHRFVFLIHGLAKVVLLKVLHPQGLRYVLLLLHVGILSRILIEYVFIHLLLLTCLMVSSVLLVLLMDLRHLFLRVLLPCS